MIKTAKSKRHQIDIADVQNKWETKEKIVCSYGQGESKSLELWIALENGKLSHSFKVISGVTVFPFDDLMTAVLKYNEL